MPKPDEPKKRKQEESKSTVDVIKSFAAKARDAGWFGSRARIDAEEKPNQAAWFKGEDKKRRK